MSNNENGVYFKEEIRKEFNKHENLQKWNISALTTTSLLFLTALQISFGSSSTAKTWPEMGMCAIIANNWSFRSKFFELQQVIKRK